MTTTALHDAHLTAQARWRIWGTTVVLAVRPPDALAPARAILEAELVTTDRAANRFRPDSELSRLNRAAGQSVVVSQPLFDDLRLALAAAERTGGAFDPTIGSALARLGYDRDFDQVVAHPLAPLPSPPTPAPGWRSVAIDPGTQVVQLAAGTSIDLGALAKAACADRTARRISRETGAGVLVDLGGDLAVAGAPPAGGWQVAVVESARRPAGQPWLEGAVSVWSGGLATSGTSVRAWRRGGRLLHHIVDPATGWSAPAVWRMATVAATTCVEANTFSTAAIVWGDEALFRLAQLGLGARLVRPGGQVVEVGSWPRMPTPLTPASER